MVVTYVAMDRSSSTLWTPTGWLALWGAVIGTVSLVWNIRRDVLQRARLKVTITASPVLVNGTPLAHEYLVYTIVNMGHRPVTVIDVGGQVGRGKAATTIAFGYDPLIGTLPKKLNHSETCQIGCAGVEILNDDLAVLWVTDSSGRRWRVSRRNMRALRASPSWNRVRFP